MMKRIATALLLCAISAAATAKTPVLKQMYDRYHGKWRQSERFTQQTYRYTDGKLTAIETWHETIEFPDRMRIDIGSPDSGNCMIFVRDSVFTFDRWMPKSKKPYDGDLLFVVGGMYFAPNYDAAARRFAAMGYNPERSCTAMLNDRKVYVIGVLNTEETTNQLWVDATDFRVLKLVQFEDGHRDEAYFSGHVNTGRGLSETIVTFYRDGVMRQMERYSDIRINDVYDNTMFAPETPRTPYHWYNKK